MRAMILLCVSALAAACATTPGPPSKPIAMFPTPASLAAVEARPVELPPVLAAEVPAEGWTADPARAAASSLEPWRPAGPMEEAFARAFSGRKARTSRALACVASELGAFVLAQGAPPPESLRRVMIAACGVASPTVNFYYQGGAFDPKVTEEAIAVRFGGRLAGDAAAHVPEASVEAGYWFGRSQRKIVSVVAFDSTPVSLEPYSVVPDAQGDVTISGRLLGDTSFFSGFINRGAFGVETCAVDPSVARPSFRVTCRMARDDQSAWMQIVYAPPGTVLALPIVQVLVRRDLARPIQYREPSSGPAASAADPAAFRAAALAGLNATRARAGMAPVRLAAAQSDVASRVSRQYFAAALGSSAVQDMNTIALGLLAGWQVQGMIRGGTFFAALLPATRDVGRWLDFALALPIGRDALMRPEIEEIALGPAFLEKPDGVGAVVTGYRFEHGDDHAGDVAAVLRRITEARARFGLSAPKLLPFGEQITEELGLVKRGEENPAQALQASLQWALRRFERSMRGYVVEATGPEAFEIPGALAMQSNLELAIGIAHYKPPGAAWSQLVIVIVFIGTGAPISI